MDEKLWDDLYREWCREVRCLTPTPYTRFSAWMYHQGCIAQAKADREAVDVAVNDMCDYTSQREYIMAYLFDAQIVKGE
jgi:hypothetical protein